MCFYEGDVSLEYDVRMEAEFKTYCLVISVWGASTGKGEKNVRRTVSQGVSMGVNIMRGLGGKKFKTDSAKYSTCVTPMKSERNCRAGLTVFHPKCYSQNVLSCDLI